MNFSSLMGMNNNLAAPASAGGPRSADGACWLPMTPRTLRARWSEVLELWSEGDAIWTTIPTMSSHPVRRAYFDGRPNRF